MNGHSVDNYDTPHVKGFNGSDFVLDPYTYSYLNSTYQRNHDPPVSYEGHYTTDVTAEKTMGFLEDALQSDRPFFLATAPIAPHANIDPRDLASASDTLMTAAISEPQYKHLFKDAKVPRTANFNPKDVCWLTVVRNQANKQIHHSQQEQTGSKRSPSKIKP